jgi:uncharacterized protein (TIGR00369 family)
MSAEERVRASFARQGLMATLGARLVHVAAGAVDLELTFDERLTQQDGYLHAGALTAALDSACGYAAFTLMPEDAAVLTVEFKVNLLAPAAGSAFSPAAASSAPAGHSPCVVATQLRSRRTRSDTSRR